MRQFAQHPFQKDGSLPFIDSEFEQFQKTLAQAEAQNGWFTSGNLQYACKSWAEALSQENVNRWLAPYHLEERLPKRVAIIMAGNIPLVGFHDFLSVLATGNHAIVKLSSDDKILLPFLASYLQKINPELISRIMFTNDKIENFDAVIATGSDNTARYFEYYFGKKPNIIRRNRNSVAVLTGKETQAQLNALGNDIFRYFGLGCRSVSKLFVPKDYDFDLFFKAIFSYADIINGQKYANNYDYNKAVYLMSLFKLKENGFLILKEDESYASPIATLFYEFYEDINTLKDKLKNDSEKIQCVVAENFTTNEVPFGETQQPQLWDYADNIDIVSFLTKLP